MKRRLIGPTIISLVMCGLLVDHIFFNKSPWSVVNGLSRMFSIFGAILSPFNPAHYTWLDAATIPLMIGLLAVILLVLIVARAKSAMSKVTPNADISLAWPAPKGRTLPTLADAQVRSTSAWSTPGAANSPIWSDAQVRSPSAVPSKPWVVGPMAKLTLSFAFVGGLFSLSACIIVYSYVFGAFEKEAKRRAELMAIYVSEIARRHVASGGLEDLSAVVDRYGSNQPVAYVYVEDEKGKIVAHAPLDLPRHLKRDFPKSAERALGGVDVQYRGLGVYEIAKRISGNKPAGFVHFAIWHAALKEEARLATAPIAGSIFAILFAAVGIFVYGMRQVSRAFFELVEHAERISKGDFAVSLPLKRSDEIGEIARSLERMRSSMHAVAARLTPDQLTKQ
jgi:HAMP domain-containing protein